MARINKYELDANVTANDKLIGTDGDSGLETKNFSIDGIADYVIDKLIEPDATEGYVPVFGVGGTTISDSIITSIEGNATIGGNLLVTLNSTLEGTLTVDGGTGLNDTLEVDGATTLNDTFSVSGATTLNDTLNVAGVSTLNDTLVVSGKAVINAPLPAPLTGTKAILELQNGDGDAYARFWEGENGNVWSVGLDASDNSAFKFAHEQDGNSLTVGTKMVIQQDGRVGIGSTTPGAQLDVAGGIKIANDNGAASATKKGTIRYRRYGNYSYVDICMQTGAETYAWVNIVQNNW